MIAACEKFVEKGRLGIEYTFHRDVEQSKTISSCRHYRYPGMTEMLQEVECVGAGNWMDIGGVCICRYPRLVSEGGGRGIWDSGPSVKE